MRGLQPGARNFMCPLTPASSGCRAGISKQPLGVTSKETMSLPLLLALGVPLPPRCEGPAEARAGGGRRGRQQRVNTRGQGPRGPPAWAGVCATGVRAESRCFSHVSCAGAEGRGEPAQGWGQISARDGSSHAQALGRKQVSGEARGGVVGGHAAVSAPAPRRPPPPRVPGS